MPVYSALARCVLLVSFSQECRRHDCQKSSELSSAESSMISRSDHGSRGCGGSQGVRKGRKAATRSPAGVHFACCSSKAVPGIAAQSAGAAAATQGAQCKEARAGTPYVRLTAACVSSNTRHHAAVACHAGRGGGSASGGSFLCACRALLRCALRVGKTGTLLGVAVCVSLSQTMFEIGSPIRSYEKFSRVCI